MYTRAAVMGLFFTIGNSTAIVSSNVYPPSTAPHFVEGHSIAIGSSAIAIICALTLMYMNSKENARRDREYGEVAPDGSDADPAKMKWLSEEKRRRWGFEGLSECEIFELGDTHPGEWCSHGVPTWHRLTSPFFQLMNGRPLTAFRYII